MATKESKVIYNSFVLDKRNLTKNFPVPVHYKNW